MTAADADLYRALRLASLAEAPDAFGSTLAAEQAYPHDHWHTRLARAEAAQDLPLLGLVDGVPVALAWAKIDPAGPGVVHLYQMWVEPRQRGQGIGLALLDSVIFWARKLEARAVHLGVATAQGAALRMYVKAGFVPLGLAETLRDGSPLQSQPMRLALDGAQQGRRLH